MKKLFIILLLPIFIFSQTKNKTKVTTKTTPKKELGFVLNKKEYYDEFIRLLDSSRNELYKPKTFVYETKYDSLGSISCQHHNRYLENMSVIEENKYFLSHGELPVDYFGDKQFIYRGNEKLIDCFFKRTYTLSNKQFITYGECCMAGEFPSVYSDIKSNKELAQTTFNNFRFSPAHWEILTNKTYSEIGIDIHLDKENHFMYITIEVGRNVNSGYKYVNKT